MHKYIFFKKKILNSRKINNIFHIGMLRRQTLFDKAKEETALSEPLRCHEVIKEEIDNYKLFKDIINVRIILSDKYNIIYCIEENIKPCCARVAQNLARQALYEHIVKDKEILDNNIINNIMKNILSNEEFDIDNCCGHRSIQYIVDLVTYYTARRLYSYGPIYPLIIDPNIEEIAIDPPAYTVKIVARQTGPIWISTNIKLTAKEAEQLIIALSRRSGRDLSLAHPFIEGLLPEGHRIAATLGREVTRFGSSMVIRKHRSEPLGMPELIKQRVLPVEIAAYAWLLIELKGSAIIVGPTASGKTTLLQALLDFVPPWSRIVSVEDTPELNLSHHPHWDSLITRMSMGEEVEDIDLYSLARFALRRRPDYLVIGEIRGEEARVLAYAASSGHAAYTTLHAESAWMAVSRLINKPFSVPKIMLSNINTVFVVARLPCGRRVIEVAEISYDSGADTLTLVPVYSVGQGCGDPGSPGLETIIDNSILLKRLDINKNILENIIKEKITILNSSLNRNELLSRVKEYYMRVLQVIE